MRAGSLRNVLIVCGAGASSTFLASRLRRSAGLIELGVDVRAGNLSDVAVRVADIDVLLVGPHLEPRFDELRLLAEGVGCGIALLPADVFGSGGFEKALGLVLSFVPDASPTDPVDPARHPAPPSIA